MRFGVSINSSRLIGIFLVLVAVVMFIYFITIAQQYYSHTASPNVYSNLTGVAGVTTAILIISLVAAYFVGKFEALTTRSIVLGIAFAPIGMLIWLYGDYGGGSPYIWAGVLVLIVGIVLWAAGDVIGGAFSERARVATSRRRTARRRAR